MSGAPSHSLLSANSVIETILPAKPVSSTRRKLHRRASLGASAEARMASATCGTNIVPYRVLSKPNPSGLVKIELAAGNVTSAKPCTMAAP